MRSTINVTLLVVSACSFGFSPVEVTHRMFRRINRVIVASCDRCEPVNHMRSDLEKWLASERVTVGTVEWYSNQLSAASLEAIGKAVTDTDFPSWKYVHAHEDAHLWAQAIRLGTRLGFRLRNPDGSIEVEELSGKNLFKARIDDREMELLDVRISRLLGAGPPSSVVVHLLSRALADSAEASRLCKGYLFNVQAVATQLVCTIGPDDIRPYDDTYLFNNPFHLIAQIPASPTYESRKTTCLGPSYKSCF